MFMRRYVIRLRLSEKATAERSRGSAQVRPSALSGAVPSDYPAVLGALLPSSLSLGGYCA